MPKIALPLPWHGNDEITCLCGSGKVFRECCKEYIFASARCDKEDNSANQMEVVYRGELTKYLGYVLSHTVPFHAEEPARASTLIDIDVKTVCEIVDRLLIALRNQKKYDEAIKTLRHIRNIINLPQLKSKMLMIEALWADSMMGQQEKARDILSDYDYTQETDCESLHSYLALGPLDLATKIKVIDRIVCHSGLPSVLLNVLTRKSVYLHMLGQYDEAVSTLKQAIEQCAIDVEHIPSSYYMNGCAQAYKLLYSMTHEQANFSAAMKYYSKLECDPNMTDKGKADLYFEIGNLYEDKKEFYEAIRYYKLSLKAYKTDSAVVRMAGCLIKANHVKKSCRVLNKLHYHQISEELRLEFLEVQGKLAVAQKNKDVYDDVIRKLSQLNIEEAFFKDQCKKLQQHMIDCNWQK